MFSLLRSGLFAVSVLASSMACAQYETSAPITLVVAQAAGSGTDTASRLLADALSRSIGRQIVVENKPGALGTIAAMHVAKAKPDGMTLLMTGGTAITGAPFLMPDLQLNPQKDLTPVYRVAGSSLVLYVGASQGINTVREFLERVRGNPGKYSYAGSHSMNMVAMEAYKKAMQLQMTYVPYKGGPQALTDLVNGNVLAMFNDVAGTAGMESSGRVKGLAVMRKERLPEFPDLPTIYEAGYKGPEISVWTGVFVPAGTPQKTVDYLSTEIAKVAARPEFKQQMNKLGLELYQGGTQQAFKEFIRQETDALGPYIKAARTQ